MHEQRTANSEQRTANSEQRTANSEQRTANSECLIHKLVNYLLLVLFACALSACGSSSSSSGGSSDGTSNQQQTGQFIDAPVDGLHYKAFPSGLSGTTKSGGFFNYQSGDTLTFTAAGIELPPVTVSNNLITPKSFGSVDPDGEGFNIGLFLLSLSTDPSNKNTLTINPEINFTDGVLDFTQATSTFHSSLHSLADSSGLAIHDIKVEAVTAHFDGQCWVSDSCLSISAASKPIEIILDAPKDFYAYGESYITVANNTLYFVAEESNDNDEIENTLTTTYQYALSESGINTNSRKKLVGPEEKTIYNITASNNTLYTVTNPSESGGINTAEIVAYTINASSLTETAAIPINSREIYLATDKENNKLYTIYYDWSTEEVKLLRFDAVNGQLTNQTSISFDTPPSPHGYDFTILYHNDYLYLATDRHSGEGGNGATVHQYLINNDKALHQSTTSLLSFTENDKEEAYEPYLAITKDGKRLIAAIGGNIFDRIACEASDWEDDIACADRPISWLYSVPVNSSNGKLGAPLLLQTEQLYFDSVAVSDTHIFVGYNFDDEVGNKPSSIGVLQYSIK